MIHDPMCWAHGGPEMRCDCDLIARVREDERKASTKAESKRKAWQSGYLEGRRAQYAAVPLPRWAVNKSRGGDA